MVKKSRNTKQKEIIEQIVFEMNSFFSAEEVYKLAKKKDNKMGIATVYRFLNNLKETNKVYSYVCDRKYLYSKEKKNHCHFICEKTGKIIHFEINNLDFLKYVKDKIPGKINSFQLEIKGVCNDCK